ncbi:LysR family transcriptional regulator [Knoellia sinensis KCTC 19936]|uniref:LysR family transcriptional regulator n=1 Tax=Knoellia sinensis KCTC 19936 TaxID=1385520 RepID=A0A0A0JES1_9MICO|nr:ArgP/LysG family DNA-binding transcriptional regulator [Knoellia sinensis]KGN34101.1 LysR family transcriptional regulator [Knoellia sinensis KCTC 19936]
MNLEQVRALAAIVDTGSFELAARTLHLTPSAISQRIRTLESSVGQVVVRRGQPCTPTEAGAVLVRLARQVELLEEESKDHLGVARTAPAVLRVAINADSLDTWLVPLLECASGWEDTRLNFVIADEDHTLALLRDGRVSAAVSTDVRPVPGCRTFPLGVMRYLAVAAKGLAHRFHLADGGVDWAGLPALRYDERDDLLEQFLAARGLESASPPSQIPSAPGLRSALGAGLGWLLAPEVTVAEDVEKGNLVTLGGADDVADVSLHWHVWKVDSHRIDRLNDAITHAARVGLRPLVEAAVDTRHLRTRPLVGTRPGM